MFQPSTVLPSSDRPVSHEIRYERSFLLDLKNLEPAVYQQVFQFVFQDKLTLVQLQEMPGFRQIYASPIFYRFELSDCLIGVEITGQIVKFLRVIPKPDI